MTDAHILDARPEHLFWGYFDAATPPVLEIESGATVTLHCLPAAAPDDLPPSGEGVLPEHIAAMAALESAKGPSPHMMTGPVFVRGAAPGDALQVDILAAEPAQSWGHTLIKPLLGALPEEFPEAERMHVAIDRDAGVARLPIGVDLPLDPFFGVLAVAPPPAWGRVGAAEPRAFGGNMDNKELRPGTTLYLPVFNDGALFSAGDGHGRQGDGEVCVAALETALTGRFRLTVRKDMALTQPFAETPDALMSMGFHEDLDEAMRRALRDMIRLVVERTGLRREEAYMLLSLCGDLRITQVVDGEKGVHMMLETRFLPRR